MNKDIDVRAIVEKAGWPSFGMFGSSLADMIESRIDQSRQETLDDLRSYFSVNVVDRVENAWFELYGEETEDE